MTVIEPVKSISFLDITYDVCNVLIRLYKTSFYISFVAFFRFYHKREIIDYFPLCIIYLYTFFFSVQGTYALCIRFVIATWAACFFLVYENIFLLYTHRDLLTDLELNNQNDPYSVFTSYVVFPKSVFHVYARREEKRGRINVRCLQFTI